MLDILPSGCLVDVRLGRIKHGMAAVIATSAEEGIAQDDIVNVVHCRVVDHVAVNEEEDWKIHLLSCANLLLLKAEALDFGEVRSNLESQRGANES